MDTKAIVDEILSSKKYKGIERNTVEKLALRFGDIDKVKNKLHQVWGAYYTTRPDFKKLSKKYENREISLLDIARIHSSTRERLNSFEEIYDYIFQNIDLSNNILDIGCGLNPLFILSIPKRWGRYVCSDIDIEQQEFIKSIVNAESRDDISVSIGGAKNDINNGTDVVFLFKLLPVLDQQEENGAEKMIKKICESNVKYVIATFPSKSLGGKEKGMKNSYYEKYIPLLEMNGYGLISSKDFSNESVYIFKSKQLKI